MLNPAELLVDVIKLSRVRCQQPIRGQLAYATPENFLGRIVEGYHPEASDVCLMTRQAAEMLCKVQNQLIEMQHNVGLFIFDAYRPLRAVKDFAKWFSEPPVNSYELARKEIHYPHLAKNQLSVHGYVAGDVSRHCFGSTVDLSLMHLATGQLLNMGACFDYFDTLSHPSATLEEIGEEAFANRILLSTAMQNFGFMPYEKEYWHFDAEREIETPIDIEITPALRGMNVDLVAVTS